MLRLTLALCLASFAICEEPVSGGSLEDLIKNVFTENPNPDPNLHEIDGGATTSKPIDNGAVVTSKPSVDGEDVTNIGGTNVILHKLNRKCMLI